MKLKTISLWQPWASAVAFGVKSNETRGWFTRVQGRVAIHAANRDTGAQRRDFLAFHAAFTSDNHALSFEDLPFGAVVATANLTECTAVENLRAHNSCHPLTFIEELLGDYALGRYAWRLTDVRKLRRPFPVQGRQGWFTVDIPEDHL